MTTDTARDDRRSASIEATRRRSAELFGVLGDADASQAERDTAPDGDLVGTLGGDSDDAHAATSNAATMASTIASGSRPEVSTTCVARRR